MTSEEMASMTPRALLSYALWCIDEAQRAYDMAITKDIAIQEGMV